jgi:serine/threonine-protein kinase HipA
VTAVIAVYAHWLGLAVPVRLGFLYAHQTRGRELFEFEFDRKVLVDRALVEPPVDPRLGAYEGRQHPPQDVTTFGVFADASPDRWGRVLMERRLERDKRAGRVDPKARLVESDYLLGVHDRYRVGALRFRRDDEGEFLDDRDGVAAPPFVRLRELEAASLAIERDESNNASDTEKWLAMLIAPGGSLGGSRPKASVVDELGHLWIAKFPSVRDAHDVGAWETVVNTLARACRLRVPESEAKRFNHHQHTFLVKRFDRTANHERLHFASAMTLTGRSDGDDASTGASYLELAGVLIKDGAEPQADLRELWSRIVFNMLVSNADDHLRNHGFLRVPGKGWRLSDAYDMNPVPDAYGLKLNITGADNALDLDLARSVAPYFRVKSSDAEEIIDDMKSIVRQWRTIAERLTIPARERDRMASAFRLAETSRS